MTLKQGEAVVVMSELDKSQSRAISGMPGISEIPGLNDLTGKDNQKNYATLLIVITPHVIRGTQAAGHSPMMRVEPRHHQAAGESSSAVPASVGSKRTPHCRCNSLIGIAPRRSESCYLDCCVRLSSKPAATGPRRPAWPGKRRSA